MEFIGVVGSGGKVLVDGGGLDMDGHLEYWVGLGDAFQYFASFVVRDTGGVSHFNCCL